MSNSIFPRVACTVLIVLAAFALQHVSPHLGSKAVAIGTRSTAEMVSEDCSDIEQLVWFNPTPREIACTPDSWGETTLTYVQAALDYAIDINGDGMADFHRFPSPVTDVIVNGVDQPIPQDQLRISRTVINNGVVSSESKRVEVWNSSLLEWIRTNYPAVRESYVYLRADGEDGMQRAGWRDLDHDGDLDFVVLVFIRTDPTCCDVHRQLWFENIGYEKPKSVSEADINQDGVVDGHDLCLVLAAWTPDF
jgi:hypothetical protein